MKKLRLLSVIFVLISVTLSCSKDNEVATSPLVGTWEGTSSIESIGFVFNADGTGNFYSYEKGVKSTPVKLTYKFYEKKMELKIFWINMPHWDNPTDMIEIRNGNILIYDGFTYYKK